MNKTNDELAQLAKDLGADELLIGNGGVALICRYAPYYDSLLSGYYLASNRCYFAAQKFVEKLAEQGIEAEVADVFVKKWLNENNLATLGHNTLAYVENIGSYFSAQIIKMEVQQSNVLPKNSCKGCTACCTACPTGALTKEGFNRALCVRQHMEGEKLENHQMQNFSLMLGCQICQQCCKLNAKTTPTAMPTEHKALFEIENIIKNYDQIKADLSKAVGKNMLARQRLLAHAYVIAKNTNIKGLEEYANQTQITHEYLASAIEYYLS